MIMLNLHTMPGYMYRTLKYGNYCHLLFSHKYSQRMSSLGPDLDLCSKRGIESDSNAFTSTVLCFFSAVKVVSYPVHSFFQPF